MHTFISHSVVTLFWQQQSDKMKGKMNHLNSGITKQMLDAVNDADQVKRTLSLLPPERMPGISAAARAEVSLCSTVTYIEGAHTLYIFSKPVTCN